VCEGILPVPHTSLLPIVSVAQVQFTLIFSSAGFFLRFLPLYSQSYPFFALDVLADSQLHKTRRGSAGLKNTRTQSANVRREQYGALIALSLGLSGRSDGVIERQQLCFSRLSMQEVCQPGRSECLRIVYISGFCV
jgi:hypothetical protein